MSNYYFLFHHHGAVTELGRDDFARKCNELCDQWENERNDWGKWHLPVLPDDMMNVTTSGNTMIIEPDESSLDGSNSKGWGVNANVSSVFEDSIIGPCLLETDEAGAARVRSAFKLG